MKFGTVKDYMEEESRKLKKEKKKKWWNFDHRATTSSCISAGDSADGKDYFTWVHFAQKFRERIRYLNMIYLP